ncbi:hypothetical protein KDA08_04785, partial [Candidatus Saccharibacteria bacterium]|nr:hypothetical protein [Candidatus Saccharibacteria bacterium]
MLIGSLLISGLSLTWLLAAPAGGIALVLGVLVSCKQRYRDTLIDLIKPGNRLATLFGVAIALIGLMQIFVQVFYSKGSTINEGGGIFIIDSSFYILTILLTLGLIYLAKSRLATIQTIVATLVGPALSVGVLYLYQTMTIHRADYYYYKLSWIVLVLLFVFSATTIVVLFTRLAQAVKLFPSFMSLIAIIVFYVSIIQIVLPGSDFLIFGWSAIDKDVARNILDNSAAIQASGPNSSNNIVVASNNQEEDIVAYAFMHNTLNNQYEPGKCNIPMGSQRT